MGTRGHRLYSLFTDFILISVFRYLINNCIYLCVLCIVTETKKKYRQYNIEHILNYGFIQSTINTFSTTAMCLVCQKVFTDEATKPFRPQERLITIRDANKKNMDLLYFQTLEKTFSKQPRRCR